MKQFVISVNDSLKENEGLINISVNNYLKMMKNSNSKLYLRYCLKQAVEYATLQGNASIETMPLIQFYSILNLSKAYIIIKLNNHNIKLTEVETLFSSHGASSKNVNEVTISKKGTFIELSKIRGPLQKNSYTLIDLYKRLPDLYEYLPLVFSNNTDYIPVQYWQTYMYETGEMDSTKYFHWLVVNADFYNEVLQKSGLYINKGVVNSKIVFSKKIEQELLNDILIFDCNGKMFLDKNEKKDDELLSIYLVLLKYSSLVRYKPKNWNEKINSNELVIIEKVLHNIFLKYWAYIAKDLGKRNEILI